MASGTELAGRVALVTGGGRGIGRGIALELAQAGARVAVAARSAGEIEETAAEAGGIAIQADMSDREAVEHMVERTESELGPLDVLVCNAGMMLREDGAAWSVEPEDWWRVFEVNVLGVYLCCRAAIHGCSPTAAGESSTSRAAPRTFPGSGIRRTAPARPPSTASARTSRTSWRRTTSPSSRSA